MPTAQFHPLGSLVRTEPPKLTEVLILPTTLVDETEASIARLKYSFGLISLETQLSAEKIKLSSCQHEASCISARSGTMASYDSEHSSESSSSSSFQGQLDNLQSDGTAYATNKQKRVTGKEERNCRLRVRSNQNRATNKIPRMDGRLHISVKDASETEYLTQAISSAVTRPMPSIKGGEENSVAPLNPNLICMSTIAAHHELTPRLNIVIMVIGSRGDAQPFLKIGKVLNEKYGHRVRIATHPTFRQFVEKNSGLEFFSVGGDPSELMSFMVKNPGMIPTLESVKSGEISRKRAAMAKMFEGFWRACITETDTPRTSRADKDPFVADAIIANPPSFAHIHCAEALGIPLHLMFTFPYTPTQRFPHPLAIIKKSNMEPGYTNLMSYPLVEMVVWQGLGDLINHFRINTLGLDPVSTLWAPGSTYRLHVPFTYLWSPSLAPKPDDWSPEIDVSGFVFLDLASSFTPSKQLEQFLDECEEPPIYIGFGSIVVDDPDAFTEIIFEAVRQVGCRALVSKGWGDLGRKAENPPENIFILENIPHDWLFPRVRACVTHGGARTTAAALRCGKPTMVIPFFGDQHFWGSMISAAKIGPEPIPFKIITAEKLAGGIRFLFTDAALAAARCVARGISKEGDGAENAVRSFHRHLNIRRMRCSILQGRIAAWTVKGKKIKLSTLAADVAVQKGLVQWKKLRLLRHREWNDFEGPGEPVTGIAGSIIGTIGNVFGGVAGVPYKLAKSGIQRREKRKRGIKSCSNQAKEKEENASSKHSQSDKRPDCADLVKCASSQTRCQSQRKYVDGIDRAAPSSECPSTSQRVDQSGNSPKEHEEVEIETYHSASAAEVEQSPTGEALGHVRNGIFQSAAAIARAPADLSMAVAQGFHNAPRLYGDDTVRRPPRVTGIKSGLNAAGTEFMLGIYDGWAGLVKHPVRGAQESGVKGCVKGLGMGVTGFLLKDIAAIISPLGYTMKGVIKQVERRYGPLRTVRRARIAQGRWEWENPQVVIRTEGELFMSKSDGYLDLDELRSNIATQVIKGWETINRLEDGVNVRDTEAGRHSGLTGRIKWKGKPGRKTFFSGWWRLKEQLKH